jgi:hypothetical protein
MIFLRWEILVVQVLAESSPYLERSARRGRASRILVIEAQDPRVVVG